MDKTVINECSCGSIRIKFDTHDNRHRIYCYDCGALYSGTTLHKVIALWNENNPETTERCDYPKFLLEEIVEHINTAEIGIECRIVEHNGEIFLRFADEKGRVCYSRREDMR